MWGDLETALNLKYVYSCLTADVVRPSFEAGGCGGARGVQLVRRAHPPAIFKSWGFDSPRMEGLTTSDNVQRTDNVDSHIYPSPTLISWT